MHMSINNLKNKTMAHSKKEVDLVSCVGLFLWDYGIFNLHLHPWLLPKLCSCHTCLMRKHSSPCPREVTEYMTAYSVGYTHRNIQYHKMTVLMLVFLLNMWQSCVEIEGYSVVYFNRIAVLWVPYPWISIKGRVRTCSVDAWISNKSTKHIWALP